MSVFRVVHEILHVEAENKRAALAYARSKLSVEELSSKQIVALDRSGIAIIDASTGESIGAESQDA